MNIRAEFEHLSKPDAQNFLALHQMNEWQELMACQECARLELEDQLSEKYGWLSLKHLHEKNDLRSLLASWHESDRVGMNYKHLYQTRSLRLSGNPSQALSDLLNEGDIEVESL